MKIEIDFTNNIIPTKFGKGAEPNDMISGNPIRSFPFSVTDLPKGTKSLAITMIDFDAVAVCGFPWIHWVVTDIPVTNTIVEIIENFSRLKNAEQLRGKNSFASGLLQDDFSEIENLFVGPTPPDKDHNYILTVYALSGNLEINEGFYLNELLIKTKK
ncbi:YbhB/YbcL family Raf kinase inhibitor-like protein [Pseudolactococcus yaeyamensis]